MTTAYKECCWSSRLALRNKSNDDPWAAARRYGIKMIFLIIIIVVVVIQRYRVFLFLCQQFQLPGLFAKSIPPSSPDLVG